MELQAAVKLIEKGILKTLASQRWADLGAGSGLFTNALSTLLPKDSSITAIDKKPSKITVATGINLQTITGDFLAADFEKTDGVLMANALHYVKDQKTFLKQLFSKTGRIILVEYDTDSANQWVPYPVSFSTLETMNPGNTAKLATAPSAYQKGGIYSALILPI